MGLTLIAEMTGGVKIDMRVSKYTNILLAVLMSASRSKRTLPFLYASSVPDAALPISPQLEASHWLSGQGDKIDHDDTQCQTDQNDACDTLQPGQYLRKVLQYDTVANEDSYQ